MLALGQTVFWDEPMKAVLWGPLAELMPQTTMLLGVMDTDYFSRPPATVQGRGEYKILPHNDYSTKELWVATGELSRLFGSETIPSREQYVQHGVQLELLARTAPEGRRAFLDRVTEAWGWTGLVNTGSRRLLAGDVPLADVLPALIAQLEWGLGGTTECLVGEARQRANQQAQVILGWVRAYADLHPNAKLVNLYLDIGPRIYGMLLGHPPDRVQTILSSELFRFNRSTAERPRFRILDLFLRPETAQIARAAYDDAVHGSEIYTLDRFGDGAIPFDLVVPGHGRGTIHITPGRVVVDADEPLYLKADTPITSAAHLAEVVERSLGDRVALIGKAVTLVAMCGAEHVVVFNETGSSYVWRTEKMASAIVRRGCPLPLYPILRLQYPTWDVIGATGVQIQLPEHLAATFGVARIAAEELGRRWRAVCAEQEELLQTLARIRGPRGTLAFLEQRQPGQWQDAIAEFDRLHQTLIAARERIDAFKAKTQQLYASARALKQESELLAREKGRDYRATVAPLREQLWMALSRGDHAQAELLRARISAEEERRASTFDERWIELRRRIRDIEGEIARTRAERRSVETALEVREARSGLMELSCKAQAAKLELVRNAILTSRGLRATCNRPTAWWLPLLSPDGAWFRAVANGTKAYLEPLSPQVPATCAADLQPQLCKCKGD